MADTGIVNGAYKPTSNRGAPFSEQVITPIISELTLLIILFTFVIAGVLTHLHSLTNWGEL